MKILHVIFSMNIGGAENMLVDIINEQSRTHEVQLIIINSLLDSQLMSNIKKGVAVHYINRKPGSINPTPVLKFNYLLSKIKPDVVHCHDHNAIKLILFKIRAKTCLTIHDVCKPLNNLTRYDQLFAISQAVKADIFKRGRLNSTTINNGINFQNIEPKSQYVLSKKFKIVQVGRLYHEKKGQDILIKALHQLVFKCGLDIELDFLGDGPSREYLLRLAESLKIDDKIRFMGNQSRNLIYKCLKNYDILVQPSIYEGFGLTVIEGIAAGLPVVVSNNDGPAEIVKEIGCGWTFEPQSHDALASVIATIVELYKANEITNYCQNGYLVARQKYSIQQTANRYIQYYQS